MSSIFTKIINREIPSDIIFEDNDFIVIKDINPEKNTHLLIILKREIISINDINIEDTELMGRMLVLAKKIAKLVGVEKGYLLKINTGTLQDVKHIHMHLLSDL